jgi:ribonuclease VapC
MVAHEAIRHDATISAVNYAEILQKAAHRGVPAEDVDDDLDALTITVSPFGRLDARLAASFYRHRSGLSLADRVCLALARSLSSPAYTADRIWERWGR